jgi:hypothetical protein
MTARLNSATLTGLAACLFAAGIVALLAALFRGADHPGPLLWIGLALLIGTIGCWFAAARAEQG